MGHKNSFGSLNDNIYRERHLYMVAVAQTLSTVPTEGAPDPGSERRTVRDRLGFN